MFREIPDKPDPMLDILKILVAALLCLVFLVLFIWHGIFGVEALKQAKKLKPADILKPEVLEGK